MGCIDKLMGHNQEMTGQDKPGEDRIGLGTLKKDRTNLEGRAIRTGKEMSDKLGN